MKFDFVPLHIVAAEIAPNLARHHEEMNTGDDYGCPNIDWDSYLKASHFGHCFCATVRDDENKLVGYSVYQVGNNLRYKHIISATSDGMFLEKEYRDGTGIKLQKFADEKLKGLGVMETIYITNDSAFGKFLDNNGYKTEYKLWRKVYG